VIWVSVSMTALSSSFVQEKASTASKPADMMDKIFFIVV
jgi:hypothetical protein